MWDFEDDQFEDVIYQMEETRAQIIFKLLKQRAWAKYLKIQIAAN